MSKSLGSLFTGPARTWSFTGDVAGPIYTGGGIRSANDQAEARREQSLAAYELTIQNAFREVEDALIAVRTARESRAIVRAPRRVPVARRDAGAGALRQWLCRLSRRPRHRAQPVLGAAVARRRRAATPIARWSTCTARSAGTGSTRRMRWLAPIAGTVDAERRGSMTPADDPRPETRRPPRERAGVRAPSPPEPAPRAQAPQPLNGEEPVAPSRAPPAAAAPRRARCARSS